VRLRTTRTKGSGSRIACLTMVFKLAQAAERKWRKLNGHALLGDIIQDIQFKDGIKVSA
jgi:putative transposase